MVLALGSIIQAAPAAATPPDPGINKLVSFLDGPTNSLQSWSQALGTIGKLADALPAVQTSPGAALGFNDLLDKAFHAGTKKLSDAAHDADLNINQAIDLGDGRTGTLVTALGNSGSDKTLSVDVSLGRDLVDQPLSVNLPIGAGSNAPQSAFSSTGGVTVHAAAELKFDLVWDSASNTVYLKVANSGGTTPALTVDATASFADKTAVKAS